MIQILLIILILFAIAAIILLVSKTGRPNYSDIENKLISLGENQERVERVVREEIIHNREEQANTFHQAREEQTLSLKSFQDSLLSRMTEISILQKNQLETFSSQLSGLTQMNEEKLEGMRQTLEQRVKSLQEENSQKLDQMRATVEEKLHVTLEKRLGDSFKLVSERLELVHQGLGEMKTLASSVGDLKKVLTNVKTRGTWGEIQLGSLLEQILTSQQYAKNVVTKKGSNDYVEFAVRLPGQSGKEEGEVWLPIDAKFPQEDYQRLLQAQDEGNAELVETRAKQLEARIKAEAKGIKEKYLDPPNTTDFGIMFLPIEGLYAEVLRRPALAESLQREFRVVVAGPTTLTALLNSLQMGFRTLAIEKRSSEVWRLLGAVKQEFGRFGDILEKTHKKLSEASATIELASRKSRTIENKLKNVQELPSAEAVSITEEKVGEITDKGAV